TARQVPSRYRAVRPGGKIPEGGGTPAPLAPRNAFRTAGKREEAAGSPTGPAGSGCIRWDVGGGASKEYGVGVRADLIGVFHGQGRKSPGGRTSGGCGTGLRQGRRAYGRSRNDHVAE